MAREQEWEPGQVIEIGQNAQLDYVFGFGKWLPPEQTIAAYSVTPEGDVTLTLDALSEDKIRVVVAPMAEGAEGAIVIRVETDANPPLFDYWTVRFVGVAK